jgi:hypothetical protein
MGKSDSRLKWIWRVATVLIVAVVLSACGALGAEVRFQNATTDFEFYYGVKVDDAEFLFTPSNPFSPGESTSYDSISPGLSSVQAKTVNGYWLTVSAGSFEFEAGKMYTISIGGSTDSGLNFFLVED